jgi:hypothetical protein
MSCEFTIDVDRDPADLIRRARAALVSIGGTMTGNEQAGEVAADSPFGRIEGHYSVAGNAVSFVITRKPVLVPCKMIESQIRGLL